MCSVMMKSTSMDICSLVLKMRNHNSGSGNKGGSQLVFSASLDGLMNRL